MNGASVVSSDEMSSCASRSRTSVTDRRLIQTCQPRHTTTKIFRLLSSVNFCVVVDNKNMAGPIKRTSSSTNTLLYSITGTVASCYKSHRLSTCLRPLNYVVLFTTITHCFKVRPYFLQISINCRPWRHQLVMILWLNSQQNRLLQCKQSHEAIRGAFCDDELYKFTFTFTLTSKRKAIYITI